MARNRLNPWPSVADLFSALTVVSLAALIIVALGAVRLTEPELLERNAAKDLATIFKQKFNSSVGESVTEAPCADRPIEQCIAIAFRFKTDSDQLSSQGSEQAQNACHLYREAVDQVVNKSSNQLKRTDFVLLIEGHTDDRVPAIPDGRERFLYNWKLSSGRAAQVLYEFRECGVSPENGYYISSVGLAATQPLCGDARPSSDCFEQNRRTTMRIRVETSSPSAK